MIFCTSGWLGLTINPDKWSSAYINLNISNQRKGLRHEFNVTDVRIRMSVGILTAITTKTIVF